MSSTAPSTTASIPSKSFYYTSFAIVATATFVLVVALSVLKRRPTSQSPVSSFHSHSSKSSQPLSKANGPASPTAALQNLNGTVLHIPHLLTHTTTCSSRSLLSPPWPPAPWPLVPTVARKFTIRAVSPQCTHVRYIISFVCCFFETRFMRRDYDTMDKSENLA